MSERGGPVRVRTARARLVRSVGGSAAARLLVLPISAVLGIFVTRLLIDNYGQASYAQYMLLVGIVSLIPFADLGISASIMNATAAATTRGRTTTCAAPSSRRCGSSRDPRRPSSSSRSCSPSPGRGSAILGDGLTAGRASWRRDSAWR